MTEPDIKEIIGTTAPTLSPTATEEISSKNHRQSATKTFSLDILNLIHTLSKLQTIKTNPGQKIKDTVKNKIERTIINIYKRRNNVRKTI